MDDTIKQELQQKYMEVHMMSQQIKQVQTQLQTVDGQLEELDHTVQSVESLKETIEDTELFVSVSPGIFVKAKLADTKNLLLNVGAGTGIEKSIPETVALIRSQINEIGEYRKRMVEQLELMTTRSAELELEMEELGKNV